MNRRSAIYCWRRPGGGPVRRPGGDGPTRASQISEYEVANVAVMFSVSFVSHRSSPAGLDGSNSAACGIPQYKPVSDTILDSSCSPTLPVPYYQSVAYAGLDGACPPPPGVAKDKSVPDPRLYRACPTTRSVALD